MRDIVAESRVQGSISSATRAKDVRSTAREFSVSSSQLLPLCLGASASWHSYGKVVVAVIGVVVVVVEAEHARNAQSQSLL